MSSFYERCLYKQLDIFDVIFSQTRCGIRKAFSVVKSLLPITEKQKVSLDRGGAYGALLTNLLNVFDCLFHYC